MNGSDWSQASAGESARVHARLNGRASAHAHVPAPGFLQSLAGLLRDPRFQVPGGAKMALLLGLLYVVSPLDVIPDLIPVLGLTDDAFVAVGMMLLLRWLVEKYRATQTASPVPAPAPARVVSGPAPH